MARQGGIAIKVALLSGVEAEQLIIKCYCAARARSGATAALQLSIAADGDQHIMTSKFGRKSNNLKQPGSDKHKIYHSEAEILDSDFLIVSKVP
jgi:hypothetical protein